MIPLILTEKTSSRVEAALRGDRQIIVWWATEVECASAIARLERTGRLTAGETLEAHERLAGLINQWREMPPTQDLRELAKRTLRLHNLRAADALQLAAAITAAERRPPSLEFVTLDERLKDAAEREGFRVLDLSAP